MLPWLGVIGRFERRFAEHQRTDEFVYLVAIQRVTGGVRLDITDGVIVKVEYLLNQELPPLRTFRNDVFTSSFVWVF